MLKVFVLVCASIVSAGAQTTNCPLSPEDCPAKEVALDLIFLIDGSDSINDDNFTLIKNWTLSAVDQFQPAERFNEEKLQVTVVQYSERFVTELDAITVESSSEEIRDAVVNITQMKEGTKTYGALDFVTKNLLNLRADAYKVLITMTDGRENDDRDEAAINDAKNYFDLMVAVGVGKDIDWGDLLDDLSKGLMPITTDNFVSLDNATGSIAEAVNPVCVGVDATCLPSTDSTVSLALSICTLDSADLNNITSILSTYEASITPTGTGVSIVSNSISDVTATFTGLDPNTAFSIAVEVPISRRYNFKAPSNIICTTKDRIDLEVKCENVTESSLCISYSTVGSTNRINDVRVFSVAISPPDADNNPITKTSLDDELVMFTGLKPNTTYTVTITGVANDAEIVVTPGSRTCTTRVTPTCEEKAIGLTFLIDGSDSIEEDEYKVFINWTLTVIDAFNPKEREKDLRIDVVQFSSTQRHELDGLIVTDSADEIRREAEAIYVEQLRSGTRPYSALQYVNELVASRIDDGSEYRILVTITDGNSIEDRDDSIVQTARENFPRMLLFQGLDVEDDKQEVLNDLTYKTNVMPVGNLTLLPNVTRSILDQIHEDCVIISVSCESSNSTDTSVTVSYSYTTYPSTRDIAYHLQNLIVTISPTGTSDNSFIKNFNELTSSFTGLSPNTNYEVTVTGTKVTKRYFALVPASINCPTKAHIQLDVKCESKNDNTLSVSYSTIPAGLATDSTLIQSYQITISQNGVEVNSLTRTIAEQRIATFSELTANTLYTITVTIVPTPGAEVIVIPGTVNCVTTERVNLFVQCDVTTDSAITVVYSTNPPAIGTDSSYIQSYVVAITPSGMSPNPVTNTVGSAMAATFSGLQSSTDYIISVEIVKAANAVFEVNPVSTTCRTYDVVSVNAACQSGNDSSLTVSYGTVPAGYASVTGFSVVMSLNGVTRETTLKSANELMASFYGLSPSTRYSFTITAILDNGASAVLSPDTATVECETDFRECTEIPINLVFLIDGSDSLTEIQFTEMKNYILEIVDAFNPSTLKNKLRVDVVQYSSTAQTEILGVVIQSSSEEIRAAVEGIASLQCGTRPYTGLRHVNGMVTNEMAFKIFILLSDGKGREAHDQAAIDLARINFDLMIAVAVGQDADVNQLLLFSDVGNPLTSRSVWFSQSTVEKIRNASCEEDNIQFVTETTATTENVNVNFYPIPIRLGVNSSLVDNYTVGISSNGAVPTAVVTDPIHRTASFSSLTPGTAYSIFISGSRISGANIFIDEASTTAATKPSFKPVVRCESTSENTVNVSYTVSPDDAAFTSSNVEGYTVVISPSGTAENTVRKTFGEMTATFSGLLAYTNYTVMVTINKTSQADIDVQPGSITCTTRVSIRPEVTCSSLTNNSVEVSYSVSGPGATSNIIQGYTIRQGTSNITREFVQNTATISALSQCTDYNVIVEVDIDPSVQDHVDLQHGSVICRTGEQPSAPVISVSTGDSDTLNIMITPLACVTNYVIIYDRTDCDGTYCMTDTTNATSYTIPNRVASDNYSITVYGNYPASGLGAGTTENVSASTPTSCTIPIPTAAPVGQTPACDDSTLTAAIVLGVLLAIAVLVIIVLAVMLLRK